MNASLYLHIPFCSRKCSYCSFASVAGLKHVHRRYCHALQRELSEQTTGRYLQKRLETLFIGGGTPTVIEPDLLHAVVRHCATLRTIDEGTEVTLEANPETIAGHDLQTLRRLGVNRLSLGIQSLKDRELDLLGRVHNARTAIAAVAAVRRAGMANLNLDLMYGLPYQQVADWREVLTRALDLHPEHVSMYQLSIEPGTPFALRQLHQKLPLPAEGAILAMDEITAELCSAAGFEQYEVSNYARPGNRCRHNLVYWQNEPYDGCGAAAVSYQNGERAKRVADPIRYCQLIEAGATAVCHRERLDLEASYRETIIMGLRLIEGVDLDRLQSRFNLDIGVLYGERLKALQHNGLIVREGSMLRLTRKGQQLANQVLAELV